MRSCSKKNEEMIESNKMHDREMLTNYDDSPDDVDYAYHTEKEDNEEEEGKEERRRGGGERGRGGRRKKRGD